MHIKIGDTVQVLVPYWNQTPNIGPYMLGRVVNVNPAEGSRQAYYEVVIDSVVETVSMWVVGNRVVRYVEDATSL